MLILPVSLYSPKFSMVEELEAEVWLLRRQTRALTKDVVDAQNAIKEFADGQLPAKVATAAVKAREEI